MSYQLLLLFLLCIMACFSDMQTGKVKNRVIVVFLILGLLYYAVRAYHGFVLDDPGAAFEVRLGLINFAIAFVVSFALRSFKIWPAGDAKTYLVCNLLIPIFIYHHIYFEYFPGFSLLMNIFIAGILYIMLMSLIFIAGEARAMFARGELRGYVLTQGRKLAAERWNHARSLSAYFMVFLSMFLVMRVLQQMAPNLPYVSEELFVVLIFIAMRPIGDFIGRNLKSFDHALFYIIYYTLLLFFSGWNFDTANAMLLDIALTALKFLFLYGSVKYLTGVFTMRTQVSLKKLSEIEEGDLLTEESLESLPPDERARLDIPPEGLTADNLRAIQGAFAGKRLKEEPVLQIYKPIPFVPVITAGVLFTVITGLSAMQHLKEIIFG